MLKHKYPCMFVGESGTAKSVIISNYLSSLPSDDFMKLNINFSSRTTSKDLQANFVEKNYIYERSGNLEQKIIKDTQIVSALLPPSVATMVDPRLLSLFTTFNLVFPSQENLQRIYNSILGNHLKKFPN